jgi:hypothetical protein
VAGTIDAMRIEAVIARTQRSADTARCMMVPSPMETNLNEQLWRAANAVERYSNTDNKPLNCAEMFHVSYTNAGNRLVA